MKRQTIGFEYQSIQDSYVIAWLIINVGTCFLSLCNIATLIFFL